MSELQPGALMVSDSRTAAPIVPRSTDDIAKIAKFMLDAGALPKSYNGDAKKAAIAIMKGLEIGWLPMQSVQNMYVINGIPTIYGDGAIALARSSGHLEYCKEWIAGDGDDRIAFCEVKRVGEPEPMVRSFSKTQAAKAGLLGKSGPWQQYPDRMMQMRARAYAIRDVFADALMGLRIKEEVEDHEIEETPAPTINPFSDKAEPVVAIGEPHPNALLIGAVDVEPEPVAEPNAEENIVGLLQEPLAAAKTADEADQALALWLVTADEKIKDADAHLAAVKIGKRMTATRKAELAKAKA